MIRYVTQGYFSPVKACYLSVLVMCPQISDANYCRNGYLDQETCTCVCPPNYSGENCQNYGEYIQMVSEVRDYFADSWPAIEPGGSTIAFNRYHAGLLYGEISADVCICLNIRCTFQWISGMCLEREGFLRLRRFNTFQNHLSCNRIV